MDITFLEAIKTIAAPIVTVAGAIYAVQRVNKGFQKSREEEQAKVLQEAKEASNAIKVDLEAQIHDLHVDLRNHKEKTDRELEYLKEANSNEIASLSEKIEHLRDELRSQHVSLMTLITKLIEQN